MSHHIDIELIISPHLVFSILIILLGAKLSGRRRRRLGVHVIVTSWRRNVEATSGGGEPLALVVVALVVVALAVVALAVGAAPPPAATSEAVVLSEP